MENYFLQHFILNPVSVIAPGLAGCDEEPGARDYFKSFFFFSPEETEEGEKAARVLTPGGKGRVRGKPQGVLLLPGWRHRGPSPAPWVASWPVSGNCSFLGTEGCVVAGHSEAGS